MGNYIDDVDVLNRHLTGWLVEYNFKSPYQSLGYATPIEFLTEKLDEKVLPTVPYPCVDLTKIIYMVGFLTKEEKTRKRKDLLIISSPGHPGLFI